VVEPGKPGDSFAKRRLEGGSGRERFPQAEKIQVVSAGVNGQAPLTKSIYEGLLRLNERVQNGCHIVGCGGPCDSRAG
jgi:hypothetical protein